MDTKRIRGDIASDPRYTAGMADIIYGLLDVMDALQTQLKEAKQELSEAREQLDGALRVMRMQDTIARKALDNPNEGESE